MAERLQLIRITPERVLDASLQPQASASLLHTAYPQAGLDHLVTDAEGDANHGAVAREVPASEAWWQRWTGRRGRKVSQVWPEANVPEGHAGLVWSNMSLYLQADPAASLQAWRRALRPDGFVMFSTLGPGTLAELRQIYAEAGWGTAHGPFWDMHDLGDMLVHAGFADPVMDQESLTLRYADPARLWSDLRSWGRNAATDRVPGWRTPSWRRRLEEALLARADEQGRFSITLELVYGHAVQAPDKGPAVAPETAVDLAAMRKLLKNPRR